MPSVFARVFATMWRVCCVVVAMLVVAFSFFRISLEILVPVTLAVGGWLTVLALVGAVRAAAGARPGDARDPVRRLSALLARWRALVLAVLAMGVAVLTVLSFVLRAEAGGSVARGGVLLGVYVLARARHLAWFAGARATGDQRGGVVRFASARVPPPLALVASVILAVVSCSFVSWVGDPKVVIPPIVLLAWFAFALPIRYVTVGADGLLVSSWRDTFVPFAPASEGAHAVVELHSGWIDVVRPRRGRRMFPLFFPPMDVRERQQLRRRLEEHIGPHLASSVSAAPAVDPSVLASAAALDAGPGAPSAASDGRSGYRVADVPRETLWRIVETPALHARVRVRAAELATTEPHDGDDRRLIALAERTADPALASTLARLGRLARG